MREIDIWELKNGQSLRPLVAEGRVTPAARSAPRRSPRPLKGKRSASAILLAERGAER